MIGIMGAMIEEVDSIIAELKDLEVISIGQRIYHLGKLNDIPVIVVHSRIGKVAASSTATVLITKFNVNTIIFTGVAGSADPYVEIGDVVIGTYLYQHDMDASPLFPKYEIPLSSHRFETNTIIRKAIVEAVRQFLPKERIWEGSIASGDKFFHSKQEVEVVKEDLPDILCVEMEGAAVAQVCYEYQIPFAIFRTISDKADEIASFDFTQFVDTVARKYAVNTINNLFKEFGNGWI
jgi:adenosylhomocysteine nucleosidase